jgi:serine protease Do
MSLWKSGALAGVLIATAGVSGGGSPLQRWDGDDQKIQALEILGGTSQLGLTIRDIDENDPQQPKAGVIVDEVKSGSAAEKAGIKTGDAIVEFDGERVRSARQLTRLVRETPVGRKVPAVLSRDGQRVTVTIAPERGSGFRFSDDFGLIVPPEPPTPPAAPAAPRPPRPPSAFNQDFPAFSFTYRGSNRRLGITGEELSEGLSDYFGVKHGVLVRSVSEGSVAAKTGLKPGDVITALNGTSVDELSDIGRAIDRLGDDVDLTIEIVRDKKPQTLKGKLEPRLRARSRTIV